MVNADLPILLLSGMAADERLFAAQLAAFPGLRVVPWMPPKPGETLKAYAARLAPRVDPGRPCLVGGASFGGVVALELATHLPAVGCLLLGSLRTPMGLPWYGRLLQPIAVLGPDLLRVLALLGTWLGVLLRKPGWVRRLRRLAQPSASFERWALCAIVQWRPSPATRRVRTFHIHGEADRVLPVARGRPDVVVSGGGHALTLFSPAAVNAFIADVLRQVEPLNRETLKRET